MVIFQYKSNIFWVKIGNNRKLTNNFLVILIKKILIISRNGNFFIKLVISVQDTNKNCNI